MKRAGTIIDLKEDKVIMLNKEVDLHLSTAGHYCIDISGEPSLDGERGDCYEEVFPS